MATPSASRRRATAVPILLLRSTTTGGFPYSPYNRPAMSASRWGFVVLEASSGDESLAVLQSGRTVDVLLSDVVLPGAIDGFVLSTWVRDNRPGTKTILTASAASVASSAARLCNSDGPLPKPHEPRRVLERIHRLTGRAAGQSGR